MGGAGIIASCDCGIAGTKLKMKCFAVLLCLALACQAKNMTRVLLTDAAASKVRRQTIRSMLYKQII